MFFFSLFFAISGCFLDLYYTQDWWKPQTITNTIISLEGIMLIFAFSGVSFSAYKTFFRKKMVFHENKADCKGLFEVGCWFFVSLVLFLIGFHVFGWHSFHSNLVAIIIPLLYIYFHRPDLIKMSLLSGIFMTTIAVFVFLIIDKITPGWIEAVWKWGNLSGIVFLRAPLEDIIWFFWVGAFFSPIFPWWKRGEFVSLK